MSTERSTEPGRDMLALCLLMLWVVGGMAARAEDPKAAARAIGQAGLAQAGALARSAGSTATVPGYAGTDVPERALAADGLQSAAQARLSDPGAVEADAGRTVIEGPASRPAANVPPADPVVVRAEGIADAPQSPAHRAHGLASGGVSDCDAALEDATAGDSCGGVRWCVGAGCESVSGQSNTGLVDAAARLNMAMELGGEEFDRDNLRFFAGTRRSCRIRFGGLANCCRDSGLLVGQANCSAEEIELAEERNAGNTHYLGKRCARRVFGVCTRRVREWCVFGSKLGRILQQQARAQLGSDWSDCQGFTVAEIERIDFDGLDLSEFTDDLMDGSTEPSISLPEAGDTQVLMQDRVREFYRSQP